MIEESQMEDLHHSLKVVADNKARDLAPDQKLALVINGLAEEREQTKNCPTCGTKRPDFMWLHITPAGRLFMAAMDGGRG
jgi:hypothetical protein